ncbi:ATP-binding cassette domain-containing protein, partial [Candidatus Desantisbacteria bacterium]|nr:ATP-binding cassette domain-containing protein [Candidatus Desantisbacteria bacterium]
MSDILTVLAIRKSYQLDKESIPVLNGITLEVSQGEILAIIGPSGAGKSTLLHILGGLDVPTEGKVLFKDKDIFDGNDMEKYRS